MKYARIVASTYVDHQAQVQYPVELVVDSLAFVDEHWLFGSDAENTAYMAQIAAKDPKRLRVACLEHGIRSSVDISVSMNLQVARLKTEADYILLAQADTLATPDQADELASFCRGSNRRHALHFPTRDAHCYLEFWSGYGHTLVGADWEGSFTGDGSWTQVPKIVQDLLCLHVGYLTPEACARHMRQHGQTYGEPPQSQGNHEKRAKLWEQDPDEFVRDRARWMHGYWRQNPWSPYPLRMCGEADRNYLAVVERLGKMDEYLHVQDLIKTMHQQVPWSSCIPQ